MSDPEPPRVHVTLPGGGHATGRLLRWRQGPDGRWAAEVAVHVPAAAVEQVEGEVYADVPREPATPPEVRYVLDRLPAGADGKPRLVLHVAGCWATGRQKLNPPTPVPTARDARDMLRFNDTTACTVCSPAP